jgi:probable HAF family extracellular repeat protein
MGTMRIWLRAIGAGCLILALAACNEANDVTSVSDISASTFQAAAPSAVPVYKVTPINAIVGLRVNQTGDVVGWTTATGVPMLYTAENGVIVLPNSSSQPYGVARDLSDRQAGVITVVGEARLPTTGPAIHAVRWKVAVPQGTVLSTTDLGVLPGASESFAQGVNGAGQIVGTSDPSSFLSIRSFIYSGSTGMVDLGLGGPGQNARALDLNASGTVTGYLGLTAFRWTRTGGLQSLGAPAGFPNSFGFAINNAGQVGGYAGTASGIAQVVARYSDGSGWKVLGGMGQRNEGHGINQWGDVVGTGFPRTGSSPSVRAVIYTDILGVLTYVDDLLFVPGSWKIMAAYDINDGQQITGWGINNQTGLRSAVLLTPVTSTPVNQPPVARFTVTCSPGKCVLDASSSTDDVRVTSYNWKASVANRPAKTGVVITRHWLAAGGNTYVETLTVRDAGGLSGTRKMTIVIPAP